MLARTVINEFVSRQEKVERELYNYSSERHGIVTMEMAPQYWIGKPENLQEASGRKWLEAYLGQFTEFLLTRKPVTDLRPAMPRMEEVLASCSERQRRSMVALYVLFNRFVGREKCSPQFDETIAKYGAVLDPPCVERLIVALIFGIPAGWTIEQHQAVFDTYFRRRNTENGIRVPTILEGGLCLMLVEAYRKAGLIEDAKRVMQIGAENFPALPIFRTVDIADFLESEIDSGKLLLPQHEAPETPPSS